MALDQEKPEGWTDEEWAEYQEWAKGLVPVGEGGNTAVFIGDRASIDSKDEGEKKE